MGLNMLKSKRVAIAYIRNEKDELLMGKRNDCQKWCSPGGHLNKGEDPFIGMARELKEETNLDVEKIKLAHVKWVKEKNILLYLFEIEVSGNIDLTKDPDKEFVELEFKDPIEVCNELHVPAEHNIVLKYWFNN
jgi:8-oxo-dGTP pyrophosphatase MutT (NUDIX family)